MTRRRRRRGGILFEVLLSLGLFIAAAAYTLAAMRSVLGAIDRSGREAMALDLARAKLAELEAGLVTIAELREDAEGVERVGSIESFDEGLSGGSGPRWTIDVETERTEFTGLTLVALTVTETADDAFMADDASLSITLRQLMALREDEGGDAFETDEILRGLPAEGGP